MAGWGCCCGCRPEAAAAAVGEAGGQRLPPPQPHPWLLLGLLLRLLLGLLLGLWGLWLLLRLVLARAKKTLRVEMAGDHDLHLAASPASSCRSWVTTPSLGDHSRGVLQSPLLPALLPAALPLLLPLVLLAALLLLLPLLPLLQALAACCLRQLRLPRSVRRW